MPITIAASPYKYEIKNNQKIDENIDFIPLDLHRNKRNTETVTEDGYFYTLAGNNWEASRIDRRIYRNKKMLFHIFFFFWNNDYFFTIDGEVYCKKIMFHNHKKLQWPRKIFGWYKISKN